MSRSGWVVFIVLAGLTAWPDTGSYAQQVQLTSPLQTINDSFYENFGFGGINMGRSGPRGGWYLNTGPATSTPPPFGGYDPAADARFGMQFGGPFGLGFNLVAGQGSTRSNTVTAPTIVIPNGGTGSIFSGSVRPFVTGVIPVVGNAPFGPMMPMAPQSSRSPLAERVAQLQQQQAATQAAGGAAPDPAPAEQPALPARDDGPLVIKGGQVQAQAPAGRPAAPASASDSTANHGDLSVAEIRRQQAAQDAARLEEIQVRIEKARGFEEAGKPGQAKIYYQQAATRADGEQKKQLLEKIRSLGEAK
ncbi:MAG: hypothetical protein MUF25_09190 [Pirellulaceae bacterium]|nr:hypothetical protein [Pirellulaceae bacterium]